MKTVNSISGGKTSAFMAAHNKADYDLFALVRTDDVRCKFPDETVRKQVEDIIQKPFIGTLEDDLIIYTMLDLEQFLGRKITWVTGITYDEVIQKKGGWLPNKLHRYCTTWLKINPMFYWWAENIGEPIEMRIGYRANETGRMNRMLEKRNTEGLLTFEATFEKNTRGQNKWEEIAWQKPVFPLIESNTLRDTVVDYWADRPVRFAPINNCVMCFHRNPLLLSKMFDCHPNKMQWAKEKEKEKTDKYNGKGTWRNDVTYTQIEEYQLQGTLDLTDFSTCDSGGCTD